MAEYAIELKGITKRFPGVVANNNISFSVEKGEIHALAGENGCWQVDPDEHPLRAPRARRG